jgi:NADH dehydrogenase
MEAAAGTTDEDVRAKALTFVFVGGGYTGVEALAELEDMVRDACSLFPTIDRDEMRWVLVEASDRILANVAEPLQGHALELLRSRGIDVRLETTVDAVEGERIHLSDGDELDADTLVWAAGVQPNPLVAELGLPTDERGRLPVNAQLEVRGAPDAWAAGDNAAVPDLTSGGLCPPTAQHAEREARQLAANVAARVHRQPPAAFQYSMLGQMITLGRYKGVAELFGVRLRGFLPWFMRRTYYASRIPTLNRKLRLVTDWTVSLMFARDAVNLGSEQDPAPTLGSRRRTHPQLPPGRSEPSRPDPGRTESSGPDQNRTNDAETGAHRHG